MILKLALDSSKKRNAALATSATAATGYAGAKSITNTANKMRKTKNVKNILSKSKWGGRGLGSLAVAGATAAAYYHGKNRK